MKDGPPLHLLLGAFFIAAVLAVVAKLGADILTGEPLTWDAALAKQLESQP
jgi:hypothetical protein